MKRFAILVLPALLAGCDVTERYIGGTLASRTDKRVVDCKAWVSNLLPLEHLFDTFAAQREAVNACRQACQAKGFKLVGEFLEYDDTPVDFAEHAADIPAMCR